MSALGLGKTLFNSSVCYFENSDNLEIYLTERLLRKKASGTWPSQALIELKKKYDLSNLSICENRDVEEPHYIESLLNSHFPFFDYLKNNNLHNFSIHFNEQIQYSTHHLAHAYAAAFMSPFEKCLIFVIDGAGSRAKSFKLTHPELDLVNRSRVDSDAAEERTLYLFEAGQLKCVDKKMQNFTKSVQHPEHYFSEGLGTFYEKISEYVFDSKRSAGKVMGLAALGQSTPVLNSVEYLNKLDWSLRYSGKSKKEWESSAHLEKYRNISADVQYYFEQDYIGYIKKIKETYPDYNNLIVTGGCALNCTTNMKLFNLGLFDNIYVPPFPGDESISLGAAYKIYYEKHRIWKINTLSVQNGYFGPKSSAPDENKILELFAGYKIESPESIIDLCAELLANGHTIAWFQGRSESGPRALGNRSILSRPDQKGIKDYLNTSIKFRESFRPYGCSTLFEKSHLYFEVPKNFDNSYMSFATRVRSEYQELLNEVSHFDKTSRMQTVRETQNKLFYQLIKRFGERTNLYCLLNTSLNVMGEPIVETIEDAKCFLDKVPVYGLAIGNYFIKKPSA